MYPANPSSSPHTKTWSTGYDVAMDFSNISVEMLLVCDIFVLRCFLTFDAIISRYSFEEPWWLGTLVGKIRYLFLWVVAPQWLINFHFRVSHELPERMKININSSVVMPSSFISYSIPCWREGRPCEERNYSFDLWRSKTCVKRNRRTTSSRGLLLMW